MPRFILQKIKFDIETFTKSEILNTYKFKTLYAIQLYKRRKYIDAKDCLI